MCDDNRKEALRRLCSPRAPMFWGTFPTTEALGQLREETHEGDVALVDGRFYWWSSTAWSLLGA